ncbi:DUF1729 domain-containing protein, partial [Corynebacterium sp. 35RC1]|nr:DUF1729 domain-containing protein [Corynebacterium sp. 35RC1]
MPTPITAPAILFQGQASAWQDTLAQAAQSPHTANRLRALLQEVKQSTAPLARELASTTPGLFATLDALVSTTGTARVTLPAVSIPGIVLGQIAALDHLQEVGINPATAQLAGHSQGSLGVAAVHDPAQALGIAVLMGTAAATVHGSHEQRPQMLSVRGASREFVTAHLSDATELAVINGPRHFVLSGTPEALAATQHNLEQQVAKHNAALEQRTRGGTELQLSFDLLPVALPFHHSSLQPAVELTAQYAATCGYSEELARKLAQEILVDPHDWPSTVAGLKATHLLSLDERLSTITSALIAGSGQAIVSAHTPQARDLIGTAGFTLPRATNYAQFAPKVVRLPNGNTYTQTRFTEWTGRSPIMLGGMTPTTVDAEIVAAAANAGFWTELAGGGMYSEEIFLEHKTNLTRLLAPGRAAQFNTMFFDRFMWNLQFGVARIVPKARANGAPIDGVTISAGIPEPDEAAELLRTLRKEGFAHISFKPGTVEQIRACVEIAKQNPDQRIIVQIEDGHAGGHHSWVDLDEMLLETYAAMREQENIAIAVGGGFHSPQRAAEYLTGRWSTKHGMVQMPVDAVFVGTVAMACKEAKTSPQVKQLLVETPGLSPQDNGGWVGRGKAAGGVASSQSHLLADLHELDNDFAAASRLITSLPIEEYPAHREEIIAALERTAKPYFGDVTTFTYAQWATRFAELAFPWQDPTWLDRWHELLQRIEARLHPQDHGPVETLFPTVESATDAPAALERLRATYPQAETTTVLARDAAWFTSLHRKHPKPMPWTAALDADLKEWFGKDTLWQCHDPRYPASAVRVIPGPVSVAGITEANEPVAQLLQRFEDGTTNLLLSHGAVPTEQFARLGAAPTVEAYLRTSPTLVWHGRTISNPAARLGEHACTIEHTEAGIVLRVHADSAWDTLPPDSRPFHVAHVDIPVLIPEGAGTGAAPLVDDSRLPEAVFALLAGVAGVGSTSESGDAITALPTADAEGNIHYSFTLTEHLLRAHTAVTGAGLGPVGTPDVLVGPCWPAIYAALGTGVLEDGFPVIEGLLNAVHLDHVVTLLGPLRPGRFTVTSRCASIQESSAGRVVTVELELSDAQGTLVATQTQRFAIRGRAEAPQAPAALPPLAEVSATPRSFMSRTVVKAPMDMTPFAIVSGDYNPIHTSTNAAKLVDLDAPLVHGMWLSATAQHQAATHGTVQAWAYSMYGMVQLGDEVEITMERVGRTGTQAAVEVTCRIEGTVVSQAQGLLAPKRTAYIYPGQGIQTPGMGQADRQASPAARAVWQRADQHTTSALGFSIIEVVDQNPTTLVVGEQTFRHPQGVLHLTQFTQVALAVVAYAQTQRLREAGVVQSGSMYAGHSLGEYTALACMANIFDLEAVIDIVYSRGSAMATLVPRDANGESNYAMGALRPNMLGVAAEDVEEYVAQVARESGEFLEIVNYNIAGQQYSVAGTKAGLAALEARTAQVHERALVIVPGIDVPFHSRVLREGVAAFAEKLNELLPATLDLDALVGRYIPNLVARPFELTQEFVDATAQLAPGSGLEDLRVAETDPQTLARTLLIALLSWQFASPVRWIETQDVLFSKVEELLEVGLASSPTLTNLAKRSMEVRGVNLPVRNAERDLAQILMEDVTAAPVSVEEELVVEEAPAEVEAPTS